MAYQKSICEKCGQERVKVTGMVCPDGHGKIRPAIPGPRGRPRTVTLTAHVIAPDKGYSGESKAPYLYWLVTAAGERLPNLYRKPPQKEWRACGDGYSRTRFWRGVTISARLNGKVCKFTVHGSSK